MTLFLYRLFTPRPMTFASDMTTAEANAMREHVGYWHGHAATGKALVFGPVADPEGMFGLAVIVAEDGEDIEPLCKDDPAIKSGLGFSYKLHLMPQYGLSSRVSL
jgi:hypothetical protein